MTDSEADQLTEQLQFEALCDEVFSPSAPIHKLSLFAGRREELDRLRGAINTRGCHAIIFGDRGVGKTSLAGVLKDLFAKIETIQTVQINCTASDDFQNAWRKALAEIVVYVPAPADDENPGELKRYTLDQYMANYPVFGPGEVKHLLKWATAAQRFIIVFDEFDRLPEAERVCFADTLKDISDHSTDVNATLVLVGVASDTVHLITEHASITRCLRQIQMPLMSRAELSEIVKKALPKLKLTIDPDATNYIVSLSQGLPNYTHSLAKESALRVIRARQKKITTDDVLKSVNVALNQVDLTISNAYHKAVTGLRTGELFPQVMLACALAPTDPLGYFRATDVRDPLCRITQENYQIADFSANLDKLASDPERGRILEKVGTIRKYKYRFADPLLRPFIILKRLTDKTVAQMILDALLERDELNAKMKSGDSQRTLFEDA